MARRSDDELAADHAEKAERYRTRSARRTASKTSADYRALNAACNALARVMGTSVCQDLNRDFLGQVQFVHRGLLAERDQAVARAKAADEKQPDLPFEP